MKWELFLKEWGTEDQNVFLFMQWCLWSIGSASEATKWCDWSRLEVEMVPMRNPGGSPVVFTIGETRVLDLFGVRLCSKADKSDKASGVVGFSAETFTHWVHAGCTTHPIQTFLRKFVMTATRERKSPPTGALMFLCTILKKSGWLSWRCGTCASLVETIRENILSGGDTEEDPYGLHQKKSSKKAASAPLSTEEWVRLLACNGRFAVEDPSPVLVGGEARKVWVQAALAVQKETRKILEHTTQMKMRQDFLDALAEAVASEATTAPTSPDRQAWIRDASPRLRTTIQQWLVTNFRFIPFSEIDFERLSTAVLIFRTAFFNRSTISTVSSSPEPPLETIEGLFQMSTLLLEPHDRQVCQSDSREMDYCRAFYPMHRQTAKIC